jgi:hypothetical protein
MATTAERIITIVYSGDTIGSEIIEAADNTVSPGSIDLVTLASGFNSITVPTGGATCKAVTIKPPSGNTIQITLKGITGDTGVLLHLTDPSSISLSPSQTTIGLNAASSCPGVRLYWS